MANTEIRLPAKWIELNITKRECVSFIACIEDDTMCQCGRRKIDHGDFAKHLHHQETWNPPMHTRSFPTDAYGSVIFEGEHHPNKAHFVRMAYDTNPELVIQLMTLVWCLEMPKLVISIRGGSTNFELSPRIGKILQTGLIGAAKSTGAWIFTGGLNDGVTKHIGTALSHERSIGYRRGRMVTVGIAPWGVVEHKEQLIVRNKDRIYSPLEHSQSKLRRLNPRHANFLLVDNGSSGKMGGESYFRRRLEKCIASHSNTPHRGCDIPIVCVVIEGGFYTLRNIGDYLHDEPPTPVVIFAGTGRTADLVAWVLRKMQADIDIESMREDIYTCMIKLYKVSTNQCAVLFAEIQRIVARKNLVTVYNPLATNEEEFDAVILASIFRSQHWSPLQQLTLSLVWDRVDIANNEVFVYGREWSREHLEHAMMEALVSNRLDFVSLLLEHGLNMQIFLTTSRLEALYSVERSHSKFLRGLVAEMAKTRSRKKSKGDKVSDTSITLHDIGIAISHMMGHIYKSNYIHMVTRKSGSGFDAGFFSSDPDEHDSKFENPFDDLFVWAVLTKRHYMALLLWRHGQGALAKSLVAVKLNKYMADELVSTEKTETSLVLEFQTYANEWEALAFELLDSCFRNDNKLARQLLTMELEYWSNMTCLTLAVMANHRMLLGHPCSQMLLHDLWMGVLNIKTHATLKIILGIIFPPCVIWWDYKSTEELKLLPHQERPLHVHSVESETLGINEGMSDTASLRTYNEKSRSSLGQIFRSDTRSRLRHKKERTDMTEVVKKLVVHKEVLQEHHHKGHIEAPSIANTEIGDSQPIPGKVHHRVTIDESEKPLFPSEQSLLASPSVFRLAQRFADKNAYYSNRSSYITTRQTLRVWNKFYEFQRAPVTNFFRHAIAYLVFVCLLSYVILVPQNPDSTGISELYVTAYLGTLGLETIRMFIAIDALNCVQKWVEFRTHVWQIADFGFVCFFLSGTALRNIKGYFEYGMLLYRVSSIYWNLRLYKYMGVHRFVGPKIVMMSKMLKHMAYFAMIILVVIIAFGMAREAIRFPHTYPTWRNIAEGFLEPYVMMFGEVDTDSLSPQCGEPDQPQCPVGYWIIPVTWVVYMMVANILIVNVLIAVFNGIYSEIEAVAVEVWMFQRFTFVMEFEEKPLLPPPGIIICHIYQILKWLYKKTILCLCEQELDVELEEEEGARIIMGNDHRLKTFLNPAEACIVFDFEEDNLAVVTCETSAYYGTVAVGKVKGFLGQSSIAPTTTAMLNADARNDRQGIQQLKLNFRELAVELESHRSKLDKLLSYWEIEQEKEYENSDNDDIPSPSLPDTNVIPDKLNAKETQDDTTNFGW